MNKHETLMLRAVELARRGIGRTAPNPPVGALIVKDGAIVGEGFHPAAGQPHAEVFALRQAGRQAAGAALYVTLEPCNHHGRTPPCTDALIEAGIEQVFVGSVDPDPRVAGRGIDRLQRAGLQVESGLLGDQCRSLIVAFSHHLRTGRPLTIYKAAMTLDGNTAAQKGDARWVSGETSRARAHQLRNHAEAIMVGSTTVLNDDPCLTCRLPDGSGRDPLRVVIDGRLRMSAQSRMLQQDSAAGTLIITISEDQSRIAQLTAAGAEVLQLPATAGGQVPLAAVWAELGRRSVQQLLLEGGPRLARAVLQEQLIERIMVFVAPKLLGGSSPYGLFAGPACELMADALRLNALSYEQLGEDLLITGDIKPCSPV